MKKNTIWKFLALAALTIAASSCGKIPEAYQGEYTDPASATKVKLDSGAGTLTLSDQRVLQADASSLSFDDLMADKPGIYVRQMDDDKNILEVFWIFPQAGSRKVDAGFTWETAELVYSRMDTTIKDQVNEVKMLHCKAGTLMLDEPSKTWNGGCPAGADTFTFERKNTNQASPVASPSPSSLDPASPPDVSPAVTPATQDPLA